MTAMFIPGFEIVRRDRRVNGRKEGEGKGGEGEVFAFICAQILTFEYVMI